MVVKDLSCTEQKCPLVCPRPEWTSNSLLQRHVPLSSFVNYLWLPAKLSLSQTPTAFKSYANMKHRSVTTDVKSFAYRRDSSGSGTNPWKTSQVMFLCTGFSLPTLTLNCRLGRSSLTSIILFYLPRLCISSRWLADSKDQLKSS